MREPLRRLNISHAQKTRRLHQRKKPDGVFLNRLKDSTVYTHSSVWLFLPLPFSEASLSVLMLHTWGRESEEDEAVIKTKNSTHALEPREVSPFWCGPLSSSRGRITDNESNSSHQRASAGLPTMHREAYYSQEPPCNPLALMKRRCSDQRKRVLCAATAAAANIRSCCRFVRLLCDCLQKVRGRVSASLAVRFAAPLQALKREIITGVCVMFL